jgi:hypothetical protein
VFIVVFVFRNVGPKRTWGQQGGRGAGGRGGRGGFGGRGGGRGDGFGFQRGGAGAGAAGGKGKGFQRGFGRRRRDKVDRIPSLSVQADWDLVEGQFVLHGFVSYSL